MMLYVNYSSETTKETMIHRKRFQICTYQRVGVGEGTGVGRRDTLPVIR